MAVDPSGNVWIANSGLMNLQKYAPDGTLLAEYDRVGPTAQQFRPEAVAAAADGSLYVLDVIPSSIRILHVAEPAAAGTPPTALPGPRPAPGPTGLPAPTLGKTVNVQVVKGTVLFKPPATTAVAASAAKGNGFVTLASPRQMPVGSLLNTRRGTVRLTSATANAGTTQSGDFAGGLFQTLQSRTGRSVGLTELRLKGSSFSGCAARKGRRALAARGRTIRRLRSKAKGRFRTRGQYSAATVRGTEWDTTDSCAGTLTQVRRGTVVVRIFAATGTCWCARGTSTWPRRRRSEQARGVRHATTAPIGERL